MVLLISPFAPRIAEELWIELGHAPGIMNADWPAVSEEALKRDELQLAAEKVQQWLEGKNIRKVIVVPSRLVNIAVS